MKSDISIIIPGIRVERWVEVVDSLKSAIKTHTYEIIFCGPFFPPKELEEEKNVKFIRDFGSPSRAMQLATYFVESDLLMWAVDDGVFLPDSLDNEIETAKQLSVDDKIIINLLYTEGEDYKYGQDPRMNYPQEWFKPHFHADLRLEGISRNWMTSLLFIIKTEYYRNLGGLDCRFEHVNMNLHDFMFRAQRDGAQLVFSSGPFQRLEVQLNRDWNTDPIMLAFVQNDRPLLHEIYATPESAEFRPISIDIENWRQADKLWRRKWAPKPTNS